MMFDARIEAFGETVQHRDVPRVNQPDRSRSRRCSFLRAKAESRHSARETARPSTPAPATRRRSTGRARVHVQGDAALSDKPWRSPRSRSREHVDVVAILLQGASGSSIQVWGSIHRRCGRRSRFRVSCPSVSEASPTICIELGLVDTLALAVATRSPGRNEKLQLYLLEWTGTALVPQDHSSTPRRSSWTARSRTAFRAAGVTSTSGRPQR